MPPKSEKPSENLNNPISPEKLDLLNNLALDTLHTPSSSFLKIPKDLPSDWQAFFDKLVKYCSRCCGDPPAKSDGQQRIHWEQRLWNMEDNGLDELDMLFSATIVKDQANVYFKNGDIERAFHLYMGAKIMFPCPDIINNIAACALKQNRFQLAEDMTTEALDTGFITKSVTKAKALYRRALARTYLGKFEEAIEDMKIAVVLQPNDASLQQFQTKLLETSKSITNPEQLKEYLSKQPREPAKFSFSEALKIGGKYESELQFKKFPRGVGTWRWPTAPQY